MSAETKAAKAVPRLIQKAIRKEGGGEEERRQKGELLRQEATGILERHGLREKFHIRTKRTWVTETTLYDESGNEVKVTISARKRYDSKSYEPDLEKAVIRIEVEDYDSLTLPLPGSDFGGEFPLPEAERLNEYIELLETVRERRELLASLSCL